MRGFALLRTNEFTYDRRPANAVRRADSQCVTNAGGSRYTIGHCSVSLPEFVGRSHDSADTHSNSNRAGHCDPPCFCTLEQVDFFNYSFV